MRPVRSSAPSSVPHPSSPYLCSSESAATGDCGAGRSCSPIWSCSVWGLPCLGHRCPSGALLPGAPTKGPHLFTLTRPGSRLPGREPGGMFSVALSVSEAYGPGEHPPPTLAVSEHTALRSSDFPLPHPCQPASLPLRTRKPALRRSSDHPACSRESNHNVLDRRGQTSSARLARLVSHPRFVKGQAEEAFQRN